MKPLRLVLLLPIILGSKLLGQTVGGRVLYDNPDKLKPTVFIFPWYLNTWKPNGNSGMFLGLKLYAGTIVDFDFDLQMAYRNRQRTDADGAEFPPFNREEFRINVNGDLSHQSRGLRTRYTSDMDIIPFITRRQCLSVRLGFNHTGSTIQAQDVNGKLVSYATNDTTVYNERTFFSSYNCIIGFSIKSIFNAVISAEGRRISTGKYMDFYSDAIINAGMNFHDVDNDVDSGYVIPQGRNPFGYRVGLQFHDPSKTNFTFGVEFGSTAGPRFVYKPNYFLFKVGFSVTNKQKID